MLLNRPGLFLIKGLIILPLTAVINFGCSQKIPSSKFLIPEDYQGIVVIEFGIEGKQPIELIDGYYTFKIPDNGLSQTSSSFKAGTSEPFQYYYYSNQRPEVLKSLDAYTQPKDIAKTRHGIAECKSRFLQHSQFLAFSVLPEHASSTSSDSVCSFIEERDSGSFQ